MVKFLFICLLCLCAPAFAGGISFSRVNIHCLGWDINLENGDGECIAHLADAQVSNGVIERKVQGEIMVTGYPAIDKAVADSFCVAMKHAGARVFTVRSAGNMFFDGCFQLNADLSVKRFVKRTRESESIGPIFDRITCIP